MKERINRETEKREYTRRVNDKIEKQRKEST